MIKSKKSVSYTNWLIHLIAYHTVTLMKEGFCKVCFLCGKSQVWAHCFSPYKSLGLSS